MTYKSFLLSLLTLGTIGMVALVCHTTTKLLTTHATTTPYMYGCASIHFGMNDDTNQAWTYDVNTSRNNFDGIAIISGVNVVSHTLNKFYYGGQQYLDSAIKLGSTKTKGLMEIVFQEEICGATFYMLGYGKDTSVVVVNDDMEIALHTNYTNKTYMNNRRLETYYPYKVDFAPTHTLKIESKESASCRFMIADIALRVVK